MIADRGRTYGLMGRYEEALADLNRAIELDPDDDWDFYSRSLVWKGLGQANQASSDLKTAIQLAQQTYEKAAPDEDNWHIAFNISLYHLAAEDTEKAEMLYQKTLDSRPSSPFIRMAISDLDELLTMYPNHTRARAMYDLLQQQTRDD